MRALGLDVGARRSGVAAGDTQTGIAVPVGVIDGPADSSAAAQAAAEAQSRSADIIVVGIPYLLSGRAGAQAEAVERFVALLREATALPIETIDERLSTAQAERSMRRPNDRSSRSRAGRRLPKGASDAAAAAVILQTWLDSRRGKSD